jgi:regulator of RNase E activity RraA
VGHDNVVLSPEIKAIAPGTRLAGPAWTVSGHIERKRARDETLLAWCTMLSKAPRGHVIVCPPHNHEIALMGELLAQTLQARRVLGYVVDGGSRDTELVLAQGFPLFYPRRHRQALDPGVLRGTDHDRHGYWTYKGR